MVILKPPSGGFFTPHPPPRAGVFRLIETNLTNSQNKMTKVIDFYDDFCHNSTIATTNRQTERQQGNSTEASNLDGMWAEMIQK